MNDNILQRLTMKCRNILKTAEQAAQTTYCSLVDISHLAYALIEDCDVLPNSLMQNVGQDRTACLARIYELCLSQGDVSSGSAVTGLSIRACQLLESASVEADADGEYAIGVGHVLLALLSVGRVEAEIVFDTTVITMDQLTEIFTGIMHNLRPVSQTSHSYDPASAFPQRIMASPNWGGEAEMFADAIMRLKRYSRGLLGAPLISTIRKATEEHPLSYSLRVTAANILCDAYEYDEALFQLGVAISMQPREPIAYRRMAHAARQLSQIEIATRILNVGWEQYLSYVAPEHLEEDRTWWFSAISD